MSGLSEPWMAWALLAAAVSVGGQAVSPVRRGGAWAGAGGGLGGPAGGPGDGGWFGGSGAWAGSGWAGGLRERWETSGALWLGAVFVGAYAALAIGRVTVVIAVACAGGCAVWVLRGRMRGLRDQRAEESIAVFLGAVTADLRAGASLPHAFEQAAESLPESTPADTRRVLVAAASIARQGGSIGDGMRSVLQGGSGSGGLRGPGSQGNSGRQGGQGGRAVGNRQRLLEDIAALADTADRHGVPLATLLEQLQKQIDGRRRHRNATRSSLQGPQATSVVLTCLPLAGIAMGTVMGANPVGFLFGGGLGGMLLVVGVGLACAGYLWSQQIITKAAG